MTNPIPGISQLHPTVLLNTLSVYEFSDQTIVPNFEIFDCLHLFDGLHLQALTLSLPTYIKPCNTHWMIKKLVQAICIARPLLGLKIYLWYSIKNNNNQLANLKEFQLVFLLEPQRILYADLMISFVLG